MKMKRHAGEEGVSIVVALLLILVLSTVGAGLMVLADSETYSSMNYRMMSQARYGAEAGVNRAANHLMTVYQVPGTVADPLAAYDMTVSPVTFNGAPVVLSADPAKPSNYPVAAVVNAFTAAATGAMPAGATVSYNAYATLVGMRTVQEYGIAAPTVIQTWRITGTGTITGSRTATAEVSATLERHYGSAHSFGVFATQNICGAVTFGGASSHDSYDSRSMTMQGGVPVTQQTGGRVGTNGNLTVQGNADIYGNLSTPRTGVGQCNQGAVTALTQTGQAQVHEGVIQLPQPIAYPPPDPPNPMPPTNSVNITGGATCGSVGLIGLGVGSMCSTSGNEMTITPGGNTVVLGNVSVQGGWTLRLNAGNYNLNSLSMTGNSRIIIESGPVVMNIAGQGTTSPLHLAGGSTENPSFDPHMFSILYAGTSAITVRGGTSMSAMVYAPNSAVNVTGGSHFYGSVIGATVLDSGGTAMHYDRSLEDDFFVVGNYVMSGFTWRMY